MTDQDQSDRNVPGSCRLARGRACYERRAWADAYRYLTLADRAAALRAEDLERLAMSAYLIGRDEDYLEALERAHQAWMAAGERLPASRCAFWLGLRLLFRGETGLASGWLGRAERLLGDAGQDCAERGYLLLPAVEQLLAAGDCAAAAAAAEAASIGERCREPDLTACARHLQGRIRLEQGQVWHQVEAPHQAARARVLAGLACRALGDDEGAGLEMEAARLAFARLGALPDLARLDQIAGPPPAGPAHRLTPRELQVLRLIASGKTNRTVAALLFVSERTIDRHVSNIFTKLDVPSRAAATAYAYQHALV